MEKWVSSGNVWLEGLEVGREGIRCKWRGRKINMCAWRSWNILGRWQIFGAPYELEVVKFPLAWLDHSERRRKEYLYSRLACPGPRGNQTGNQARHRCSAGCRCSAGGSIDVITMSLENSQRTCDGKVVPSWAQSPVPHGGPPARLSEMMDV